jgi:hypothetical protein
LRVIAWKDKTEKGKGISEGRKELVPLHQLSHQPESNSTEEYYQ